MSSEGTTGRFRRSDRLLDSRDFRRVLRRGRRRASAEIVVVTSESRRNVNNSNGLEISQHRGRLGITTSRKVGNAVVRNRFKRRLRAWFRANRSDLPGEVDLVVIARRAGANLTLDQLDRRLRSLLEMPSAGSSRG